MTQATPAVATGAPGQAWAVTNDKVNDMVNRLVAAASPLRLIAHPFAEACGYGSAARGELAAAKDLDLLVLEPALAGRYSETVRLQKARRDVSMSVDLLVTSQARFDEHSQIPGTLEDAAHREGRVLHDSLCTGMAAAAQGLSGPGRARQAASRPSHGCLVRIV